MTSNERKWTSLDNAAKIFPATKSKFDSKVFRFSCELIEPVEKVFLQQALDETIKIFPLFLSTIKAGIFWYYLEKIDIKPIVERENLLPCSNLYEKNTKQLLFRVNYFNCRINLEVFHALSDGTGSLQFFEALVHKYLVAKHSGDIKNIPEFNYDASDFQKEADSFKKYYNPYAKSVGQKKVADTRKSKKACAIKGIKYPRNRFNVIEGVVRVDSILAKAHEYDASLTIFLISVLIKAMETEIETRKKIDPVVIAVPINLRSFFDSKTIRNFFGIVDVKYFFKKTNTLEEIIAKIKSDFKEEINEEKIQANVNSLMDLENNIFLRTIPLFLKDFILKLAGKMSSNQTTTCFSNIGRIKMPPELSKYIRLFDAFISTDCFQICSCSFENNLTISASSVFENTDIQKNFFRILTAMEIGVQIATTIPENGGV